MGYAASLEKELILCMLKGQILEGLKSWAVMSGHCLLLKIEFKKGSIFLSCFPCTHFIQLHIPVSTCILLTH